MRQTMRSRGVETTISRESLFANYRELRAMGLSPAEIQQGYLGELHDHDEYLMERLLSVVIGTIAFVVAQSLTGRYVSQCQFIDGNLWVTPDNGSQVVSLPFWTAIRVIRKHGWHLADTEPVRVVPPELTRWGHLKAALSLR